MLLSLSPPPTPLSSQATESDPLFCHGSEAVPLLNACLTEIGATPFSKSIKDLLWTEGEEDY